MGESHRKSIVGSSVGRYYGFGRVIMAAGEWCCVETAPLVFF